MRLKSTKEALYAFLDSTIRPIEKDILICFDDIYHVTDEDKKADKGYEYSLSDLLYLAADVIFEEERDKNDSE